MKAPEDAVIIKKCEGKNFMCEEDAVIIKIAKERFSCLRRTRSS